jgi:hypothetical protein
MAQGKYYKDYTNLGTSWSWNPDSIRDITNVSPNVRLISKINKKEVDWERTILFNSSFAFGRREFGGEGEDEVRIFENITIPILAIEKVEWDSTIHQYKTLKTVQIPSKYRFRTD